MKYFVDCFTFSRKIFIFYPIKQSENIDTYTRCRIYEVLGICTIDNSDYTIDNAVYTINRLLRPSLPRIRNASGKSVGRSHRG